MAEKRLTDIEIIEKAVTEYVTENEVTPFVDIQINEETSELNIDMDKEFEEKINEEIVKNGGNLEEALGDYFGKIIREMVEGLEEVEESEES